MTPRPVTTCGLPGPKRHHPGCTARFRLVEGCWCAIDMGEGLVPRLTARQWRAARRKHQAKQRAWNRDFPQYRRDEDEWVRRGLEWRARERARSAEYAARRRLTELRAELYGSEAAA